MANLFVWYETQLPDQLIDDIVKLGYSEDGDISKVAHGILDTKIRRSTVKWMSSNLWIGGFIMSYVLRANNENFLYDIDGIEGQGLQFTSYGKDGHYSWHSDISVEDYFQPVSENNLDQRDDKYVLGSSRMTDFIISNVEKPRKLSFSLQLSDHDSYEGGNLQFMSDGSHRIYNAPRKKGTVIIFDSRIRHRVSKVRSGRRESLVGWVNGPRWR
jgi:PKHD-type hydroxylase|tara:strand:+ start:148 stop:789 length:642 start_codon:yes stop_codon:yes gene_type:complete